MPMCGQRDNVNNRIGYLPHQLNVYNTALFPCRFSRLLLHEATVVDWCCINKNWLTAIFLLVSPLLCQACNSQACKATYAWRPVRQLRGAPAWPSSECAGRHSVWIKEKTVRLISCLRDFTHKIIESYNLRVHPLHRHVWWYIDHFWGLVFTQ